jgi:hypothetical protein
MDYNWEKKLDVGAPHKGYVEIYETVTDRAKVRAIINYLPNLNQFSNNKICHTTLLLTCQKDDITDGYFHWILDDICDLIVLQENIKFPAGMLDFKTMFTQHFFVNELPEMIYFNNGDYSIPDMQ